MPLTDSYGRVVVPEALREEQAAPTLVGIRNIYSVIDDSIGLTPEKAVAILRQAEFGDPWLFLELAERMEEKDLLYQGILHTRKMAVSQLDIDITAAGDDQQSVDDADFIRAVVIDGNEIDIHDIVFTMLDSLGKGFNVSEIIWDTDGVNPQGGGPAWMPFQIKWRDPRWFMFDWISGEQLLVRTLRTDGPQLPVGRDAWDSRLLPTDFRIRTTDSGMGHQIGIQPMTSPLAPFKFITHVTRAKAGLPIRGGLARIAIWVYLFKNYVLKDWVTFAEVYGQPMRLGKYGPGATENDKGALLRAVAGIGTDAAAIIPEHMAIEFVESKGGGQKSHEMYQKFCEYLDKMLTIGILGQELTTQLPRGAGSRAAAQVHDVVRRDIATDDARRVSATLGRDLIKPLIDLNRGPRRRYPQLLIGFKEEEDLLELAQALGPFVDRGMKVKMKEIREKFNLDDPEPEDEILHPIARITEQAAPESSEPGGPGEPSNTGNGIPPGTPPGAPPNNDLRQGPRPQAPQDRAPASSISNISLSPAYTDIMANTFTGNPEAVGIKLNNEGGSPAFQDIVDDTLQDLPLGAKHLLRNWTIRVIGNSTGSWIGQTDTDAHTIAIAERWANGEMNDDPPQVVRHEIGHAAADEIQHMRPEWWQAWLRVVRSEIPERADDLKGNGFEYMLKSPDEAFAEMFSYELAHSTDAEDEHYQALRKILPHSFSLMEALVRPFGADESVSRETAAAQSKKNTALRAAWLNY